MLGIFKDKNAIFMQICFYDRGGDGDTLYVAGK